jgi:hypothetical protein
MAVYLKTLKKHDYRQTCILNAAKCCFYTQNGCMNKKILQRLIPSQIPDRSSKLLCSTAVT